MSRPIWFKRKTYGWGWTPASWQGWAIIGIYTGALITMFTRIDEPQTDSDMLISFSLPLVGLTAVLLVVTVLTGEKPRWQWGKQERKEPMKNE